MVARGDLGVELSLELVPMAQKRLIKICNELRKPVITATQMLQSMVESTLPTRAEVSDVANAVFDGSDCVMTSAETSTSPHPPLVVSVMSNIAKTAEVHYKDLYPKTDFVPVHHPEGKTSITTSIAYSALAAAKYSVAKAIIVFSVSGNMARIISKARPECPIIALTPSARVSRFLNFFYGVYPLVLKYGQYSDPTIASAEEKILKTGLLKEGDLVVVCSGGVNTLPGLAYTVKVYHFGEFKKLYAEKIKKANQPKDISVHELGQLGGSESALAALNNDNIAPAFIYGNDTH